MTAGAYHRPIVNNPGGEQETVRRAPEETPTVVVDAATAPPVDLTPGTLLGDRYRIVSLLGRGGMGEVYRADDLKLGQAVALKFLSHRMAEERRLYDEVRVGRQVSHPNVCRLHDIVEIGSRLFITMEFVDGEDLASLLRRVGRLTPERALTISREICAGLAAAHDKGVIHRDLKPGNVMIDGKGRARITDFGLAISADERSFHVSAGTPAYMAPEQLAGAPATARSDVYALGLVLYEAFTGKRPFVAASVPELLVKQRAMDVAKPSSIAREMDPAVERVIARCLDPEPANRPASAEDVLRELPGGDPLAAAMAAGETPSPEMVAAAAERGDLRVGVAWTALGILVLLVSGYVIAASRNSFHLRGAALKAPAILEERAREVLATAGAALRRADSAYLVVTDTEAPPSAPTHLFVYRQSPVPMRSLNLEQRVDLQNPPLWTSGMAEVWVDSDGRLVRMVIVPPQVEEVHMPRPAVDWKPLLSMAGLTDAVPGGAPRWAAPVDTDQKAAWTAAGGTVRIEAGSYHGRPVWFTVIRPWRSPERMPPVRTRWGFSDVAVFGCIIVAWVAASLLAVRNLRRASADKSGASRLAAFVGIGTVIMLALRAHHPGGVQEFPVIGKIVAYAITLGSLTWLGYVAVEPLVRRRWPRMLIAWKRLLAGSVRDPLVGRDVLIGMIGGAFVQLIRAATAFFSGAAPLQAPPSVFGHPADAAHFVVRSLLAATFMPLGLVTFVLAVGVVTRNARAAVVISALVSAAGVLDSMAGPQWIRIPAALIAGAVPLILVFRFGLVALAASTATSLILMRLPLTLDPQTWYFGRFATGLVILAAMAVYGFLVSLGGRKWLPELVEADLRG